MEQNLFEIYKFLVRCARAFTSDTGPFNGTEETIRLANRVTSLSDKFAMQ